MKPKTALSRVSNGNSLFLMPVDGRTLIARRYRDLYESFISDQGGPDWVSQAQIQLARRCALMACAAEQFEAAFVAGEKGDLDSYLGLVGVLSRCLSKLGLQRHDPKDRVPDLQEYLRARRKERDRWAEEV